MERSFYLIWQMDQWCNGRFGPTQTEMAIKKKR